MPRPNLALLSTEVPTIPEGSPSQSEYMTAGEIAARYHVSRATAYRLLARCHLYDCAIKCKDGKRLWAGRTSRIHHLYTDAPRTPAHLINAQRQRHAAYVRWYGPDYQRVYGSDNPSEALDLGNELPRSRAGAADPAADLAADPAAFGTEPAAGMPSGIDTSELFALDREPLPNDPPWD